MMTMITQQRVVLNFVLFGLFLEGCIGDKTLSSHYSVATTSCLDHTQCPALTTICDDDAEVAKVLCPAMCGLCECKDNPLTKDNCEILNPGSCTDETERVMCPFSCGLCGNLNNNKSTTTTTTTIVSTTSSLSSPTKGTSTSIVSKPTPSLCEDHIAVCHQFPNVCTDPVGADLCPKYCKTCVPVTTTKSTTPTTTRTPSTSKVTITTTSTPTTRKTKSTTPTKATVIKTTITTAAISESITSFTSANAITSDSIPPQSSMSTPKTTLSSPPSSTLSSSPSSSPTASPTNGSLTSILTPLPSLSSSSSSSSTTKGTTTTIVSKPTPVLCEDHIAVCDQFPNVCADPSGAVLCPKYCKTCVPAITIKSTLPPTATPVTTTQKKITNGSLTSILTPLPSLSSSSLSSPSSTLAEALTTVPTNTSVTPNLINITSNNNLSTSVYTSTIATVPSTPPPINTTMDLTFISTPMSNTTSTFTNKSSATSPAPSQQQSPSTTQDIYNATSFNTSSISFPKTTPKLQITSFTNATTLPTTQSSNSFVINITTTSPTLPPPTITSTNASFINTTTETLTSTSKSNTTIDIRYTTLSTPLPTTPSSLNTTFTKRNTSSSTVSSTTLSGTMISNITKTSIPPQPTPTTTATTTTTITTTTPTLCQHKSSIFDTLGCHNADIVFLMEYAKTEKSNDIDDEGDYIRKVIRNWDIGPNKIRVGIVVYHDTVQEVIHLSEKTKELEDGIQVLTRALHPSGNADLAHALDHVRNNVFTDARSGIEKIVVPIVHSMHSPQLTRIPEAAENLRKDCVTVMAITIYDDSLVYPVIHSSVDKPYSSYSQEFYSFGTLEDAGDNYHLICS